MSLYNKRIKQRKNLIFNEIILNKFNYNNFNEENNSQEFSFNNSQNLSQNNSNNSLNNSQYSHQNYSQNNSQELSQNNDQIPFQYSTQNLTQNNSQYFSQNNDQELSLNNSQNPTQNYSQNPSQNNPTQNNNSSSSFTISQNNNMNINYNTSLKTKQMEEIIKLKHENSINKFAELNNSRIKTALLDPELLLKQEIEKAQNEVFDVEYDLLIQRYKNGEHILGNIVKEQHNDIDLESKYYNKAATIISNSKSMKELTKNEKELLNKMEKPKVNKKEEKLLKKRQNNINEMSVRLKSYQKYLDAKLSIQKLHEIILDLETKIEVLNLEIESNKKDDNFDWLLIKRNEMRSLKAELYVNREDLQHQQEIEENILKEISKKYPDLKDMLSLGILDVQDQKNMILEQLSKTFEKSQKLPLSSTPASTPVATSTPSISLNNTKSFENNPDNYNDESNLKNTKELKVINASGEEIELVYGWIVGRLNFEGQITHLLYGQFNVSDDPPSDGWIPLGKIIPVDTHQNIIPDSTNTNSKLFLFIIFMIFYSL